MSDAYFCRMEIKKFKAIWKFHLVFDVQFNIASALDPTYTIFCKVILAILYYLTVREKKCLKDGGFRNIEAQITGIYLEEFVKEISPYQRNRSNK